MISKIKGLMHIKEDIAELSKQFEENVAETKRFSESIVELRKEIDGLTQSQGKLVVKLKEESDSLKELKEDFKSEISDFKLIKSRLEKKLVEKFEEEIKIDLLPRFDRLEREVKKVEELGESVSVIGKRVVGLSSELQKFCDISSEIKKGDFELEKYAKNLSNMEKEKMELLRKIDTLERLCAKLRRR